MGGNAGAFAPGAAIFVGYPTGINGRKTAPLQAFSSN
jgi:hypothetical protein